MDARHIFSLTATPLQAGKQTLVGEFLKRLKELGVDTRSALVEKLINVRSGGLVVFPDLFIEAVREAAGGRRLHKAEAGFWESVFSGMKRVDINSFEREFAKCFRSLYGSEEVQRVCAMFRRFHPETVTFEMFSLYAQTSFASKSQVSVSPIRAQISKLVFCTVEKTAKLAVRRFVFSELRDLSSIRFPASPKPTFIRKRSSKGPILDSGSLQQFEETAKMLVLDTGRSRQSTEKTADRTDTVMRLMAGKRLFRRLWTLRRDRELATLKQSFACIRECGQRRTKALVRRGKQLRQVAKRAERKAVSKGFYHWSAQTLAARCSWDTSKPQVLSFSEEVSIERSRSVCTSVYFLTKQLVSVVKGRVAAQLLSAFVAVRQHPAKRSSALQRLFYKLCTKKKVQAMNAWHAQAKIVGVMKSCRRTVDFLHSKLADVLEQQCLQRLADCWSKAQYQRKSRHWRKWREIALIAKVRKRIVEAKEVRAMLSDLSTRDKSLSPARSPVHSPLSKKPSRSTSTESSQRTHKMVKSRSQSSSRRYQCDVGKSIRRIRVSHAGKKLLLLHRKVARKQLSLETAFKHWKATDRAVVLKAPRVTISPKTTPPRRCGSPEEHCKRQFSEAELRAAILQLRRARKC